jgi:predicted dehydrogenase
MIKEMNKNSKVNKVLIVGFGAIGQRHAKIIQSLFPSILVGILRHKEYKQEAKTRGMKFSFTSIDQAIKFNPKLAIIANPSSMHLDSAFKLADVGIHLLVEKPISNSILQVQSLIDLCHKRNITLMTAYNLRFSPSLIKFYELLQQDLIGDILSVHIEVGEFLPNWRPNVDYRNSVSAQKKLGGGVLLELSHEIDYMQWIFGSVKWVKASLINTNKLEIDVEDIANIQVGINGKQNNNQLIATLNMDFIRQNPTRECSVIGENGSLRWNGIKGNIEHFSKKNLKWEEIYSNLTNGDLTYEEEIKHFISAIESNNSPCVTGEDGYNALKVIDAARESNSSGNIVHLN